MARAALSPATQIAAGAVPMTIGDINKWISGETDVFF
jgi:hypothetical protein